MVKSRKLVAVNVGAGL